MGSVSASVEVEASLADAWDYYFESRGWPGWVDGFARVTASRDGYPEAGGTLVWRSTPAGRGTVTERVLEHEPRERHRIGFEDPQSTGELLTTFEIVSRGGGEAATRVTQEMSYAMRGHGVLGPLTDIIFVRGAVRRSLERSLQRFRLEVEELASLP